MILQKVQNLSFVKQGAINGFLLGILIKLIFIRQIYGEINYYLFPEPECYGNCPNVAKMIDYSALLYISLALCLVVSISCFVVHKLFAGKIKSQLVAWGSVALLSTLIFYTYETVRGFIREYLRECWWVRYESCNNVSFISHLQIAWVEIVPLTITFGVFLVFNVLFVFLINRKKSILP